MLGMWAWEQIYSTPDIHSYTYDVVIPTVRDPKILGLTLDPAFNFSEQVKITKTKADRTTRILKALTATHWGKQKETLLASHTSHSSYQQ